MFQYLLQEFGEDNKNSDYLKNKKKSIVWFVSNCDTPSNRMEYVKGMQEYLIL